MKTMLVVVWMLSNGSMVGEPWKEFPSMTECQIARYSIKGADGKFMLVAGCLDDATLHEYTVFMLDLNQYREGTSP